MDLSDDRAFPLHTPKQIHIPWFTWMCLCFSYMLH